MTVKADFSPFLETGCLLPRCLSVVRIRSVRSWRLVVRTLLVTPSIIWRSFWARSVPTWTGLLASGSNTLMMCNAGELIEPNWSAWVSCNVLYWYTNNRLFIAPDLVTDRSAYKGLHWLRCSRRISSAWHNDWLKHRARAHTHTQRRARARKRTLILLFSSRTDFFLVNHYWRDWSTEIKHERNISRVFPLDYCPHLPTVARKLWCKRQLRRI